ncbi:hypothetical protein [Dokdonia sp. PRO95]|uniref:hypothetical protein n=1 Tax=Dokdonia sp. PRO95 TaxID=1239415 RepID=UPI00054E3D24|nr:hypothetical protein [Dokdonia sp. PRO95]
MAKSEFSETQFVMGFLGEYFHQYRVKYPGRKPPFTLPTTSMEPLTGSDFIIKGLSNLEFYQFKRSELLRTKRGKREIKSGISKDLLPYYRFKVYNHGNIPQFDRLRDIAKCHPRFKTYYCAPKFSTNKEFYDLFWNQKIIENTAIINCNQFNQAGFNPPHFNINDGDQHYIVFNSTDPKGYMCSDLKKFFFTENILKEGSNENYEYASSVELISTLFNMVKETEKIDQNLSLEYSKTPLSKLYYSSAVLMQKYGIITQLKY